jgi:hypothetical protein
LKRILLAYHRPGRKGEEVRVEGLASKVETISMGRLKVEHSVIDEVDEGAGERFDSIYMLMFTRGGHWLSLIETTGKTAKLIPLPLTAAVLAFQALRAGYNRLVIVGLRAKRAMHLQLEDLQHLKLLLAAWKIDTIHVLLETVDSKASLDKRWCRPQTLVAPLALLDWGLADNARRLAAECGAEAGSPILHVAEPLLATWIAWDALRTSG